jgi:hypothetical protein
VSKHSFPLLQDYYRRGSQYLGLKGYGTGLKRCHRGSIPTILYVIYYSNGRLLLSLSFMHFLAASIGFEVKTTAWQRCTTGGSNCEDKTSRAVSRVHNLTSWVSNKVITLISNSVQKKY